MYSIKISYEGGVPIYRQIVNQIKQLVASGRLAVGSELPPIRKLAQSIVVNPNTVAKAYKELEYQGVIYTKQGAGCFVSDQVSPLSADERVRILSEYVQQLLTQAYQLKFTYTDIIKEIDNQIAVNLNEENR
ncbi:MAG: GntR family transcriptional regulator [Victivallaceae bacterium]|nr:GntR family transcriptional regulator [Victivallaceae bacterium]